MLAAAALGLGTCCVGAAVPALNTAEVKAVLRIPADVHAVAPIIVGVPAGTVAPAARREPQVISWR
jgi:nitroreductase